MTDLPVHIDTATTDRRRIAFTSEGVELVGDLRLPGGGPGAGAVGEAEAWTGDGWPGVVLTGPFTGVKEQVTGSYAALLAAAGFLGWSPHRVQSFASRFGAGAAFATGAAGNSWSFP